MPLLNESARTRIELAICEVERKTMAEVVVAAVPSSDDYTDVALSYGAVFSIGGAFALHWLWPALATVWLLCFECAVMIATLLAFRAGPVLRALTPRRRFIESVEQRARATFLEHELFATRERTGVLILLSELEQRVAILGDVGVDAHVKADGWQAHVARMIAAIGRGHAADGICEVIGAIGEVLAQHLPARADDVDELTNRVRDDTA